MQEDIHDYAKRLIPKCFQFFIAKHPYTWELRSSGPLRSEKCLFLTDVSVQTVGPISKYQNQVLDQFARVTYLRLLTLEVGTNILSRKVGKKFPLHST